MMLFPGTNIGFYILEALWLILANDKVINPNLDANIISFLCLKAFKLHTGYAAQLAELSLNIAVCYSSSQTEKNNIINH